MRCLDRGLEAVTLLVWFWAVKVYPYLATRRGELGQGPLWFGSFGVLDLGTWPV